MFKSKITIASLSLTLLLSASVFAQGKGQRTNGKRKANASATTNRKAGKYANQEVSYRQTNTTRKNLPPAGADQTTQHLLPYVEQDNLKTQKPKQQNLLPNMEQSNLRRKAKTRK